ncbi:putative bifunctional inhibitor/plant lipid transfer protein/seed storage helical [Medicago truncatula]|uniref:Lipid transfer protein n=1 Tax=Medicago truncatula TaxID=3880 RepID=A0A072VCI0_MEDTR|nr:Lipid transfer protein [Medicago truncatula]RHN75762.1 putative bifunctional inhibitor/plant lipid transfer protein/seed storage helical [Medicago truncatula]
MAHIVAFVTIFLITMCPISSSISCDNVYWDFVTCLWYLAAYESEPTTRCCKTVAKQYEESICECIENLGNDLDIRFDLSRIDDLPNKCHEPKSLNCSK